MDLLVVPTIGFIQLYVLVIVRLARRELVWINVTAHPTAEWIAQQLTEAFPAPRCHHITACPWRTSSPILQNLIFGTHSDRPRMEIFRSRPDELIIRYLETALPILTSR
jgi:hypothetical protein